MNRPCFIALVALGACTHRATIPPPQMPLVATPRAGFPTPPPLPSARVDISLPEVHELTLSNGLRVYIVPRPNDLHVHVRYVGLQGSENGSFDALGLNALSVRATHYAAEGKRAQASHALDSQDPLEMTTERSASHIAATTDVARLDATLAELTAALRLDALPAEAIQSAVSDQLDVLHEHVFDQYELARLHAFQMLYGDDHPLGHPIAGTHANLARFKVGDLENSRRAAFAPETSALVVIGDVARAQTEALIQQHLGTLPRINAAGAAAYAPSSPRYNEKKRARALLTPGRIAYIVQAYPAPARQHRDYVAFKLLSLVAGELASSRLFRALREQQEQTYSIHAEYDLRPGEGTWLVATKVSDRVVRETLVGIDDELARLRDKPVTAQELTRAKRILSEQLAEALEDDDETTTLFESLIAVGSYGESPLAQLTRELESIERIEPGHLQQVARRYLLTEQRGVTVSGPTSNYWDDLDDWSGGSVDVFVPQRIADKLH